jgi:hypothetical protein
MKKLITIFVLFLSVNVWSQEIEVDSIFTITDGTVLMKITNKDTCIYDTIGTIRYLLKAYNEFWDRLEIQNYKLYRAEQALESIEGIMFWQPKRKEFFTL